MKNNVTMQKNEKIFLTVFSFYISNICCCLKTQTNRSLSWDINNCLTRLCFEVEKCSIFASEWVGRGQGILLLFYINGLHFEERGGGGGVRTWPGLLGMSSQKAPPSFPLQKRISTSRPLEVALRGWGGFQDIITLKWSGPYLKCNRAPHQIRNWEKDSQTRQFQMFFLGEILTN